jgi:hypothetical protein
MPPAGNPNHIRYHPAATMTKSLRIFISCPGDVTEEPDRARQVVERLRPQYAGKFLLKPLLWGDLRLHQFSSLPIGYLRDT